MNRPSLPGLLLWHPSPILRESLAFWCERMFPGHPVCMADSPAHALELASASKVRVALIDVDVAPLASTALIRDLHRRQPAIPAVALTLYHADAMRTMALDAGAIDCICIANPGHQLAPVVQCALHGHAPGESA